MSSSPLPAGTRKAPCRWIAPNRTTQCTLKQNAKLRDGEVLQIDTPSMPERQDKLFKRRNTLHFYLRIGFLFCMFIPIAQNPNVKRQLLPTFKMWTTSPLIGVMSSTYNQDMDGLTIKGSHVIHPPSECGRAHRWWESCHPPTGRHQRRRVEHQASNVQTVARNCWKEHKK